MDVVFGRRLLLLGGSAFVGVLLLGYFTYPRLRAFTRGGDRNNPQLRCDHPAYEFGEAATGDLVRTTFLLHNDGGKPLNIAEVRPECSCTNVSLPGNVIPAGGSLTVPATLSLTNRRGKQQQHIRITSDDPRTPHLILSFLGNAVSDLELKPGVVNFASVVEGGEASQALDIVSSKPLAVSKVVPSKPELISVRVEPLDGQHGQRLHVTLKPAKRGNLYEHLKITTDNPREPELQVPVYAQVAGEVSVVPDSIYLNPALGGTLTARLYVAPGKVQEFTIKGVVPPAAGVQVETVKPKDRPGFNIKVSNLPTTPELHGKKLKILTDAKGMEEILVPIYVAGQPVAAR